jgi:hypothetical protein
MNNLIGFTPFYGSDTVTTVLDMEERGEGIIKLAVSRRAADCFSFFYLISTVYKKCDIFYIINLYVSKRNNKCDNYNCYKNKKIKTDQDRLAKLTDAYRN